MNRNSIKDSELLMCLNNKSKYVKLIHSVAIIIAILFLCFTAFQLNEEVDFYMIGLISPEYNSSDSLNDWNYNSKTEILYVWSETKDISIVSSGKKLEINIQRGERKHLYAIRINKHMKIYINGEKIYN